jgi:hypothetical protein
MRPGTALTKTYIARRRATPSEPGHNAIPWDGLAGKSRSRLIAEACLTAGAVLTCACGIGTAGLSAGTRDDASTGGDGGAVYAGGGGGDDGHDGGSAGSDATLVLPSLHDAATDGSRDGPGPDATSSLDDAGQDCNTACMTQMCAGQQTACGLGTDCEAYLACLIGCGGSASASCSSDCESTHAAGAQASAALAGCTLLCGIECAAGSSDAGSPTDAEGSD